MAQLVILGSGTPTPTAERWGTSFLLDVDGGWTMVDCGPAATYKMQQMGIAPTAIRHLFFTHYHSDHVADYPCFLMTHFEQAMSADETLTVYGPPPLNAMTDKVWGKESGAFWDDVVARTQHPMSINVYQLRGGCGSRPEPTVHVHEVQPANTIQRGEWSCSIHEVTHAQPYLACIGLRFETSAGVIAFGGDGHADDALAEVARDADLFVMAAMGFESAEWRQKGAALAQSTNVKRLVISHQSPGLTASSDIVSEAIYDIKREFSGLVYWGKDMVTIEW
ncbi:MBL fold metallo-hydrolase [Chloroflexi bacterium TSY]|nr:MBL fold metallo-hydrolase [Chloroflexi bacterium TSY]